MSLFTVRPNKEMALLSWIVLCDIWRLCFNPSPFKREGRMPWVLEELRETSHLEPHSDATHVLTLLGAVLRPLNGIEEGRVIRVHH